MSGKSGSCGPSPPGRISAPAAATGGAERVTVPPAATSGAREAVGCSCRPLDGVAFGGIALARGWWWGLAVAAGLGVAVGLGVGGGLGVGVGFGVGVGLGVGVGAGATLIGASVIDGTGGFFVLVTTRVGVQVPAGSVVGLDVHFVPSVGSAWRAIVDDPGDSVTLTVRDARHDAELTLRLALNVNSVAVVPDVGDTVALWMVPQLSASARYESEPAVGAMASARIAATSPTTARPSGGHEGAVLRNRNTLAA